jgi:hypothetical protein
MLITCIDKSTAIGIAMRFLNQHFSVHEIDAVLKDKIWLVTAQIQVFGDTMIEEIQIDKTSGKIIDYTLKRTT